MQSQKSERDETEHGGSDTLAPLRKSKTSGNNTPRPKIEKQLATYSIIAQNSAPTRQNTLQSCDILDTKTLPLVEAQKLQKIKEARISQQLECQEMQKKKQQFQMQLRQQYIQSRQDLVNSSLKASTENNTQSSNNEQPEELHSAKPSAARKYNDSISKSPNLCIADANNNMQNQFNTSKSVISAKQQEQHHEKQQNSVLSDQLPAYNSKTQHNMRQQQNEQMLDQRQLQINQIVQEKQIQLEHEIQTKIEQLKQKKTSYFRIVNITQCNSLPVGQQTKLQRMQQNRLQQLELIAQQQEDKNKLKIKQIDRYINENKLIQSLQLQNNDIKSTKIEELDDQIQNETKKENNMQNTNKNQHNINLQPVAEYQEQTSISEANYQKQQKLEYIDAVITQRKVQLEQEMNERRQQLLEKLHQSDNPQQSLLQLTQSNNLEKYTELQFIKQQLRDKKVEEQHQVLQHQLKSLNAIINHMSQNEKLKQQVELVRHQKAIQHEQQQKELQKKLIKQQKLKLHYSHQINTDLAAQISIPRFNPHAIEINEYKDFKSTKQRKQHEMFYIKSLECVDQLINVQNNSTDDFQRVFVDNLTSILPIDKLLLKLDQNILITDEKQFISMILQLIKVFDDYIAQIQLLKEQQIQQQNPVYQQFSYLVNLLIQLRTQSYFCRNVGDLKSTVKQIICLLNGTVVHIVDADIDRQLLQTYKDEKLQQCIMIDQTLKDIHAIEKTLQNEEIEQIEQLQQKNMVYKQQITEVADFTQLRVCIRKFDLPIQIQHFNIVIPDIAANQ